MRILPFVALLAGCLPPAAVGPAVGAPPVEAPLAPGTAAPEPAPPPGSLWSAAGSRALIGADGNARRVGDIITVRIQDTSTTSIGAGTQASRSGSSSLEVSSLFGLETSITDANENMGGVISLGGGSSSSTDGSGTTSRTSDLSATVACTVQAVLPNGYLGIRGTKQVTVNHETQYLTVTGVIRPRDILLDNTISSDNIADAKIEYTGVGVIADKQKQGWLNAGLNALSPF